MIICDTHKFVFVHIPKCAGTTTRYALAPYDEHAGRYYDKAVSDHPVLGPLDHHHIPLALIREYFPEDFAKLATYRSFALIRDPYSRFPSSLHERLVQRDGRRLSERDQGEIAREVDTVLHRLARHDDKTPVSQPDLIHFSRQTDYVAVGGTQIVTDLHTVSDINAMLEDISQVVGEPVQIEENKNRRFNHASPVLARAQRAIVWPIEQVVPRRIWKPAYKPIKKAFLALGLAKENDDLISRLPNSEDVMSFIAEFYARDIELFKRLDTERQSRVAQAG